MAKDDFICANCQSVGNTACGKCLLVIYCGKECQLAHWSLHKRDCNSQLAKSTWQPQWIVEHRSPTFVGDGPPIESFGRKKFLWGNVPALDILQLQLNEGELSEKVLPMLFAASGDLRNVVKTIASIPKGYRKATVSVLNDQDFDIVARNVIILLVGLTTSDTVQAVDCMFHVWYSALIRQADVDHLATNVQPLVDDVNRKITDKPPESLQAKTWRFDNRSLRLVLTKSMWQVLSTYLEVPESLSPEKAQHIRTAVTMAPTRLDYAHRNMIAQQPVHRVCQNKFREDGVLLPFGHSRKDFNAPNPTFFQTAEWPLMDSADPLNGWNPTDILQTSSGPATNDLYGKMYYLVRKVLASFHQRLWDIGAEFELYQRNAADLQTALQRSYFARIEMANICDGHYLGVAQAVCRLGPLLQTPADNPYGTLLALFMNAVEEIYHCEQSAKTDQAEMNQVVRYMPTLRLPPRSRYGAEAILVMSAMSLVRDGHAYFAKYMEREKFSEVERVAKMKIKTTNTLVAEWPMGLKLRPGQVGAEKEFRLLLASPHTGMDRYMEWVRTA